MNRIYLTNYTCVIFLCICFFFTCNKEITPKFKNNTETYPTGEKYKIAYVFDMLTKYNTSKNLNKIMDLISPNYQDSIDGGKENLYHSLKSVFDNYKIKYFICSIESIKLNNNNQAEVIVNESTKAIHKKNKKTLKIDNKVIYKLIKTNGNWIIINSEFIK